jgi:hypothetical protein
MIGGLQCVNRCGGVDERAASVRIGTACKGCIALVWAFAGDAECGMTALALAAPAVTRFLEITAAREHLQG